MRMPTQKSCVRSTWKFFMFTVQVKEQLKYHFCFLLGMSDNGDCTRNEALVFIHYNRFEKLSLF